MSPPQVLLLALIPLVNRAAKACLSLYIKQATSEPTNVVTPITTRLFPAPVKALGDGAGMLADGSPPELELLPVVPLDGVVVFPFIMPGIVLRGADMAFWANASMVLPVLALGLCHTESVSHGVLWKGKGGGEAHGLITPTMPF